MFGRHHTSSHSRYVWLLVSAAPSLFVIQCGEARREAQWHEQYRDERKQAGRYTSATSRMMAVKDIMTWRHDRMYSKKTRTRDLSVTSATWPIQLRGNSAWRAFFEREREREREWFTVHGLLRVRKVQPSSCNDIWPNNNLALFIFVISTVGYNGTSPIPNGKRQSFDVITSLHN